MSLREAMGVHGRWSLSFISNTQNARGNGRPWEAMGGGVSDLKVIFRGQESMGGHGSPWEVEFIINK